MNWYFYWYFTIYDIYKQFSWDKHFDIFATSMFSFFVASLIDGLLSMFFVLMKYYGVFQTSIFSISIFGGIFIVNYIIFLPKRNQLIQYDKYKEVKSTVKDIVVLIISALSVVILFASIMKVRDYFID